MSEFKHSKYFEFFHKVGLLYKVSHKELNAIVKLKGITKTGKILVEEVEGSCKDFCDAGVCGEVCTVGGVTLYKMQIECFFDEREYPINAYSSRNFEFISGLIEKGILRKEFMTKELNSMWNMKDFEEEMKIVNWYINRMLSIDDSKLTEATINVLKRITESMLQKSNTNRLISRIILDHFENISETFKRIATERVAYKFKYVNEGPF